jgi:hypothetical protein
MSTIFFCWDIRPDRDREYRDFISNDYLPVLAKLGVDVTDGWFKVAGEGKQVMYLGESDDYPTAAQAIESREYRNIENRLMQYVTNYSKHLARRDIKSEGR